MPTNVERGEIEVEVDGKAYTLRLGMNAAAAFEKKHNRKIGELVANAASLSFTDIRDLVWLLLQKHHSADFRTAEQAGDLIDNAGGVGVFFEALDQIVKANQPSPGSEEAKTNPPVAQAGIGATL